MALVTAATLGGTLLGSTFLASAAAFTINTAIGAVASFALSTVTAAIAGKPKSPIPSVRTRVAFGGDIPRSFILGRGATAGSFVWGNTWGQSGKVPNAYLTQVFALSDLPVAGLRKVFVNGEPVTLGATADPDGKGFPVDEYRWKGQPFLWIKFYDGTQTAADDFLVNTAASADRPWQSTRVGVGVAYAIVTARFRSELFQGAPSFRFELDGIPLDDATTLADAAQRRVNPVSQMLALMKGLSYGGQPFYGCQGFTAAQFPSADWAAAAVKARDAGFEAGGEIEVSTPVGDVIEALLASCQGRMCDDAGVSYRPIVGLPGASVASFTDDDIISTSPQSFTPFQGLADTINGVVATYASPEQNWNARTAPPLYVADLEAEDGGRRLPISLSLPLVYRDAQVQRLMKAALKEARRARRHTLTLPPGYKAVRVGDRITWTSARNGYATKAFRVDGLVRQADLDVLIEITEIDPSDYDWNGAVDFAPVANGFIGAARPAEQSTSISVAAHTITVAGEPRRPAIRLIWTGAPEDADALAWQVRVKASGDLISDGAVDVEPDGAGETILSAGLVAATEYEVRALWRVAPRRPVAWSAWLTVTTPDVRLTADDIADAILTTAKFAAGIEPVGLVSALPSPVGYAGPTLVFNTTDEKIYKYVGGAWEAGVDEVDLTGAIGEAELADAAVTAAKIAVAAIDGTKLQDAIVSNAKLVDGAVSAAKVATGAITAVKLGDGAVTELKLAASAVTAAKIAAGAIDATKIKDAVISSAKLVDGAVSEAKIATGAITAVKLSDGAVSEAKLAADAVTAAKIAVGAITAPKIGDGAVTDAKIAAGAVTSAKIATGAIDGAKIADAAVTAAKLGAAAVDATKLATGAVTAASIAAGAVTAGKIAAGAVDAATIAAGAVTAGKIAAGSVSATEIAANAISADKIAAGAVTATKIAASAVEADKIAANAVTATKISAGSVSADKIASSAVTADKIQAGAIAADKIAAGAVTASKLTLSDMTNFAGHQDMTDDDFWSDASGVSFIDGDSTAWQSARIMRLTGASTSYVTSVGRPFLVEPGQSLYVSYRARVWAGTGSCNVQIQFSASSDFSSPIYGLPGNVTSTDITLVEGTVTVPAGMAYARVQIVKGNNGTTECFFGAVICRLAAGAKLIVDGSIDADKIAANAVTATKVAASAISADKIASGAVTTDKLDANAVTAAKITAGAIDATKIAASAITADKIASNAVTAVKIAADAVTTDKLAAGAVTATEIAASAITADKIASNAVTSAKITAGAIDATKIAAGAVLADKIGANAITATKIAAGAVEADKIAAGAVTAVKIQAGAVAADKIAAGAITADKLTIASIDSVTGNLKSGVVNATQISDGAVTTNKLIANAVNADKIAANAVIAGKVAAGAISATEIAAGAITSTKIAANAVTADKISVASLDAISANLGTISVGSANIANAAIGTLKIDGDAVSTAKLAPSAAVEILDIGSTTDFSTTSFDYVAVATYAIGADVSMFKLKVEAQLAQGVSNAFSEAEGRDFRLRYNGVTLWEFNEWSADDNITFPLRVFEDDWITAVPGASLQLQIKTRETARECILTLHRVDVIGYKKL